MKYTSKVLILIMAFAVMSFGAVDYKQNMYHSAYVGYRYFDVSRDLNKGWEFGLMSEKRLSNSFWFECNAGLIPTTIVSTGASQWLLAIGVNAIYNFMSYQMFTPYVLAGVGTDIGKESLAGFNLGAGISLMTDDSMIFRAEVKNIYYANGRGNDTIYQLVATWLPTM